MIQTQDEQTRQHRAARPVVNILAVGSIVSAAIELPAMWFLLSRDALFQVTAGPASTACQALPVLAILLGSMALAQIVGLITGILEFAP